MAELVNYLAQNSALYHGTVLVFGLLVGSFLNVVIFRFPISMNRDWLHMSTEFLQGLGFSLDSHDYTDGYPEKFSIVAPTSQCPSCGHKIEPWENLPLVSYLFLRGKCSGCSAHISLRYPLVELLTGMAFLVVSFYYPLHWPLLAILVFTALLIAMSGIDIDHQLLPDPLVYSLLWSGLFAALMGWTITLAAAVTGALVGYLSLWSIFWIFKLLTHKEGMGYGDFKLMAALGAWLGALKLLPLILIASLLGAIIGGLGMLIWRGTNRIPFGPYLASAGWIVLFWGDSIISAYLRSAGL